MGASSDPSCCTKRGIGTESAGTAPADPRGALGALSRYPRYSVLITIRWGHLGSTGSESGSPFPLPSSCMAWLRAAEVLAPCQR